MWISKIIALASIISIILWAGFNITWWSPLEDDISGDVRGYIIMMIHIFGLLAYDIKAITSPE